MNGTRFLAFALIVTQVAAIYFLQPSIAFTAIAIVAALIGCITPIRISVGARGGFWMSVVLVAGMLGKHAAFGLGGQESSSPHLSLAYTIGQILVLAQISLFFVKRDDDRMPQLLPVLGLLTFLCAGTTSGSTTLGVVYLLDLTVFVILSALYLRARLASGGAEQRRGGSVYRTIAVTLAVIVVALTLQAFLKRHQLEIESGASRLLASVSKSNRTGFSGGGGLDDVTMEKFAASKEVALRVYSNAHPGYMRGEAFDRYDEGQWEVPDFYRPLRRIENPPAGIPLGKKAHIIYRYDYAATGPWRAFICRQRDSSRGFAFAPLRAAYLVAETPGIEVSSEGIFRLSGSNSDEEYVAVVPVQSTVAPLSPRHRRQLTSVPSKLREPLHSLAASVFEGCHTVPDKIKAVKTYLEDNYEYQVGIELREEIDPLVYFLNEKPPAHCEYFASAAAILLRLVNVPTRYVTGFVITERDEAAECWIARNRDAHAWVEAFDETLGWVTVEATPPAGIPPSQPPPFSAVLMQKFHTFVRAFGEFLREDGRVWFSRSVLLLVALAVLVLLFRFRKRLFPAMTKVHDPALSTYHKLLVKMDKRLKRRGMRRSRHETLHQFAERVGTKFGDDPQLCLDAQWYRLYAEARFGGKVTPEAVRWLLQSMDSE